MAFINTQSVLLAAESAAIQEANTVLPQLIEGSEPTVVATVSAVFDIIKAGIDAGLGKVPFIGGFLVKTVNTFILTIEESTDKYIEQQALLLQAKKV